MGTKIKQSAKLDIYFMAVLTVVFLFVACGRKEEKEISSFSARQKTGIYKIALSPPDAKRGSAVTASVKGADSQDLSFKWTVNGLAIEGVKGSILKYPGLKKRDNVQVIVSVKEAGEFISEPLVIANSIPQIQSAKLIPQSPKKDDNIQTSVKVSDGDDDEVSLSYKWFVNGETVFGETSDTFRGSAIKRGDKVSVVITPSDGEQNGQAITLYAVVVNSLPAVSQNIAANISNSFYTAKINAADPDGDALAYSIRQGPKGMTIDSGGTISWNISPEDKGPHSVVVSVSDGQGGEVLVPYTLSIQLKEKQ
ncbi:MAG: Ig-like domain-containing protein [Nitrospirae bacterium]|nr:Ig-like domain-containing protein [Nitrospirota bacterium]